MNRKIILVTVTLLLSFGLRLWLSAVPSIPNRDSLTAFPKQVGPWTLLREETIDDESARVLDADEYVLRTYTDPQGRNIELFVAYYKTQKAGESMHSPKNCLPGSGWDIAKAEEAPLWPAGDAPSPVINRYLIEKGADKALMLYWYQANGRVIASEYWGKIYLVLDALRTGRRDGAIVRFVVSIPKGSNGNSELETGLQMARATVPLLPKYVPD
jgi:EpsI family protein